MQDCWLGSNKDHSLAEAHSIADGLFSCDPEIGTFSAIEKVAILRFRAGDPVLVGCFVHPPSLINPECSVANILRPDDERTLFHKGRGGVGAIEYTVAEVIKSRPFAHDWPTFSV